MYCGLSGQIPDCYVQVDTISDVPKMRRLNLACVASITILRSTSSLAKLYWQRTAYGRYNHAYYYMFTTKFTHFM